MAETTVNLGMQPHNRGNFEDLPVGSYIYKDNIVQFHGSSYIYDPANFDIEHPEASATQSAPYSVSPDSLNTGWKVFASGNNKFTTGESVDEIGIDSNPTPSSNDLAKSGSLFNSIIKNGVFDLTAYSGDTYADLSAALTALNNLPAAYKAGGMSIKFVLTSDNKYVQYRLMAQDFTTDVAQWQGIEKEIIINSRNLVDSGTVYKGLNGDFLIPEEILQNTFIDSTSLQVRSGFTNYNLKYYFFESVTHIVIYGGTQGSNLLTASIWNSDKSECLEKLYTCRKNVEPEPFIIEVTIPANCYLAISDYTATPATVITLMLNKRIDVISLFTALLVSSTKNIESNITTINNSITTINNNITTINNSITGINAQILVINEDLQKVILEIWGYSSVPDAEIVDNSYIESNGQIRTNFHTYRIKYLYFSKGASVTIKGNSKGSRILVISVWNSDKTQLKESILVSSQNVELLPFEKTFNVSDNSYIAISELKESPITDITISISFSLHDSVIRLLDEVFGNVEVTSTQILQSSFIESSTLHIKSGFSNYDLKYYLFEEKTSVRVYGGTQGSSLLTASIWNSDKSECLEKLYTCRQNVEPESFDITTTIPANCYLAISDYKATPATVTSLSLKERIEVLEEKTSSIDNSVEELSQSVEGLQTNVEDLLELGDTIIPRIILNNAPASQDTQTTPDFSTLQDKVLNAVGDSVTAGNYYRTLLATRLGISVVNCGVSSSTIAVNNTYLQNQSIVEKVCGLNGNTPYPDADIWIIFGGFNDIIYNTPIGTVTSTDNTTLYGALRQICENIRSRNNNPKLILVTPYQSSRDGNYNKEMVKTIKTVANMYACPVIDLYNESGICHHNISNVLRDGVHPNDVGSMMITSSLSSGILRNC